MIFAETLECKYEIENINQYNEIMK